MASLPSQGNLSSLLKGKIEKKNLFELLRETKTPFKKGLVSSWQCSGLDLFLMAVNLGSRYCCQLQCLPISHRKHTTQFRYLKVPAHYTSLNPILDFNCIYLQKFICVKFIIVHVHMQPHAENNLFNAKV